MRTTVGFGILALGGFAWLAVALSKSAWMEVVYCGTIAAGACVAFWGVRGFLRPRLLAAGLAGVALGNALPFAVYGVGPDLGTILGLVTVAGLIVAVAATIRGSTTAFRLGMAAAAVGAVYPVAAHDLTGPGAWTPGNVLILLGLAWIAFMWPGAAALGRRGGAAPS